MPRSSVGARHLPASLDAIACAAAPLAVNIAPQLGRAFVARRRARSNEKRHKKGDYVSFRGRKHSETASIEAEFRLWIVSRHRRQILSEIPYFVGYSGAARREKGLVEPASPEKRRCVRVFVDVLATLFWPAFDNRPWRMCHQWGKGQVFSDLRQSRWLAPIGDGDSTGLSKSGPNHSSFTSCLTEPTWAGCSAVSRHRSWDRLG